MSAIGFGFSTLNKDSHSKLREEISNIAKKYDYRVLYSLDDKEIIGWEDVTGGIKKAYSYFKWNFIAVIIAPSTNREPLSELTYGVDEEIDNFTFHNGIKPPFFDFLQSICNLLSPFTKEVRFFFCYDWWPDSFIIKKDGTLNELITRLKYNHWYLILYDITNSHYINNDDYPLIFTVKL